MPQAVKRKILTITLITLSLCLSLLSPADARSLRTTRGDAPASWIVAWTSRIVRFYFVIPGLPAPGFPTDEGARHPEGKTITVRDPTGTCIDPNGHPIPYPCSPSP